MARKSKKSHKQGNSKDISDNVDFLDETKIKNEKSNGFREIVDDTNDFKKKHPCCFICGCLVAILVVSFIVIVIAYAVNCNAKVRTM